MSSYNIPPARDKDWLLVRGIDVQAHRCYKQPCRLVSVDRRARMIASFRSGMGISFLSLL